MREVDWGSMLTYGVATFALLLMILGPSALEEGPRENINSVVLIDSTTQEVFFGGPEQKVVVVSGNTSVPYEESSVVVESSEYNFTEKELEISLGSEGGNYSKPVDLETVNYTVKANFTYEVPEKVLVQGASKRATEFVDPRVGK